MSWPSAIALSVIPPFCRRATKSASSGRQDRPIWNQRGILLDHSYGPLDSGTEESIKADLLDLAIAYSELRARLGYAATMRTEFSTKRRRVAAGARAAS